MSAVAASWDHGRRAVLIVHHGGRWVLLPEEARMLHESLGDAIAEDEDATPANGVKRRSQTAAIRAAWRMFRGDVRHGVGCPALIGEVVGAARTADELCDCGLRALVMVLEGTL